MELHFLPRFVSETTVSVITLSGVIDFFTKKIAPTLEKKCWGDDILFRYVRSDNIYTRMLRRYVGLRRVSQTKSIRMYCFLMV